MPAPDHAIDAIQAPIPAVLDVWHVAAAAPYVITYAFEAQQSSEFLKAFTGWKAWTTEAEWAVRRGLDEYESVINVRFVQVAAGADPDIAFGRVDTAATAETWWTLSYALSGGQVTAKSWDAGVVFDNAVDLANAPWLILHEIGHAVMMKHTGNYNSTGATPPGPYLPTAEDNRDHTVMSYVRPPEAALANQLQLFDVAALQARWGANTTEAAGDNVYSFADDPGIFAIWDTGGTDRIEAGVTSAAADINLAEGSFSQLGGQNRMSVAWGARIENAQGGAGADRLRGNDLDNRLTGGAGGDTLEGGAGLDFLRGEEGNDFILGGAEFDDVHGNMGDDFVRGGAGDDWVVGGKDQDQLFGDEGADIVWGNLGDDVNHGGDGADQVRGGQGNDFVYGDGGADYVSGDRGDDIVFGGAGADVFHGSQDQGIDWLMDFNLGEGDRVMLDPGTTYLVFQEGAHVIIDTGGGNRMILAQTQLSTLTPGWIFESYTY